MLFARAAQGGDGRIPPGHRPFEYMLNVLRLEEGFRLEDFEARCGLGRDVIAGPLADAMRQGWLQEQDGRILKTALGGRFVNDVMELFLPEAAGPEPTPA